jgi:hypothetical protein
MARRGIVEPRGSQEPDNWTNRGIDKKMNTKERQKLFIIALKASGGNISKACDLCQCSRQTYYNWLENEESNFADIIAELQFETVERRIDLAEEKLDARLNLGSGPDIRFVLKTLGAKRGYGAKAPGSRAWNGQTRRQTWRPGRLRVTRKCTTRVQMLLRRILKKERMVHMKRHPRAIPKGGSPEAA